ncbi:MAG: HipA N-terminal domain-containing protein [Planctomycetota bacterium]
MSPDSAPPAAPHQPKLRAAIVRLAGETVGLLEESVDGTRFTYDDQWRARRDSVPISQTMPVRAAAYESKGLLTFFENLLPEGWLLEIAIAKLKISKDDAFGLLVALGADNVGAVEVIAPERETEARE